MRPITYERPASIPASPPAGTTFLAGGTDLVPLLKNDLVAGGRVVDLKASDLDAAITRTENGGWRLGALVTLAELETGPIADEHPVLAESARTAATRQIRNRASVAGNLLQRSRCGYFRDPDVDCWLKGGDECPAREGRHEHHAIFETGLCITTHPSDPVNALLALGAQVDTTHGRVPLSDLLVAPTDDHRRLHTLSDGAVITAIEIPPTSGGTTRSAYRKAMDRATWAFALVGVAAVVTVDDQDRVIRARLVAGGVAARPWRLDAAERALTDQVLSDDTIALACERADAGATPLPGNAYKRDILRGLTRRVLDALRSEPS